KAFTGKPSAITGTKLTPGQLLMSLPAGQGAPSLVIASPRSGIGPQDDRFAISGDDRNGAFVFNMNGELAALVSGGGAGWLGEGDVMGSSSGRAVAELVGPESTGLPGVFRLQVGLVTRPGGVMEGVIRRENGAEAEQVLNAVK